MLRVQCIARSLNHVQSPPINRMTGLIVLGGCSPTGLLIGFSECACFFTCPKDRKLEREDRRKGEKEEEEEEEEEEEKDVEERASGGTKRKTSQIASLALRKNRNQKVKNQNPKKTTTKREGLNTFLKQLTLQSHWWSCTLA